LIRVALISPALALRAGLRARFGDNADITVVGDAPEIDKAKTFIDKTDVIVVTSEQGAQINFQHILWSLQPSIALLVLYGDISQARILTELNFRAWGALPIDSAKTDLEAAVHALYQGLVVLIPAVAKNLMKPAPLSENDADIPFEKLTERETEVLQHMSQGLSNKQIASMLHISEHTVKFHISSIYMKLGVTNRTEAAHTGLSYGLIAL
jgi:NarL family two-component system response regulator YdfI